MPELRTERLLMRAWRDEDLDWFGRMMGDPAVAAPLGHDGPSNRPGHGATWPSSRATGRSRATGTGCSRSSTRVSASVARGS